MKKKNTQKKQRKNISLKRKQQFWSLLLHEFFSNIIILRSLHLQETIQPTKILCLLRLSYSTSTHIYKHKWINTYFISFKKKKHIVLQYVTIPYIKNNILYFNTFFFKNYVSDQTCINIFLICTHHYPNVYTK